MADKLKLRLQGLKKTKLSFSLRKKHCPFCAGKVSIKPHQPAGYPRRWYISHDAIPETECILTSSFCFRKKSELIRQWDEASF